MPNSPDRLYPVCPVGQLAHSQCLEFELPQNLTNDNDNQSLRTHQAFLINWQEEFYAYLNSCPHTQVNLNWTPNQFFDLDSLYIQCSMHGAIFEPQSGICVRGPCLGQSLLSLPIHIQDDMVNIDLIALKTAIKP